MSNRITERDLKGAIKTLNRITGNPETPWSRNEDGTFTDHIGHYQLDSANGGYKLEQIVGPGGGVREITRRGNKSETYYQIWAYIKGIEDGKGE